MGVTWQLHVCKRARNNVFRTWVHYMVIGVGGDLVVLHVHLLYEVGVCVVDGHKPPE